MYKLVKNCLHKGDKKNQSNAGLTLIELLVTITIMSILATVMVLSVSRVNSNANISSCKNSYQAYALGYASFQSDWAGSPPGELSNLSKYGYVDSKLQNNSNYSIQNGLFQIESYTATTSSVTLRIYSSWITSQIAPPGAVGNLLVISNLKTNADGTEANLDGSYKITTPPTFVTGSANPSVYSVVVAPISGSVNTPTLLTQTFIDKPNPPRVVSIFSQVTVSGTETPTTTIPYEMYLFDSTGVRVRSDKLAPEACSYLK